MQNNIRNQSDNEDSREINWEVFGKNVRKYRKRKKLTQEQLAEICHMQPNSISRIEKGTAGTKIAGLLDLADALEVSPDSLLQGNYNPRNGRYAEHFYGFRDELTNSITNAINVFFDKEAGRQKVDEYEKRQKSAEHMIDPAVQYYDLRKPSPDPNLKETPDRRRQPHDRR